MSQEPLPPAPPAPPASPYAPPPPGGGSGGPRLPWEERERLGFVNALLETAKLLVTAPGDAFARLRADGDLVWPLVFGLIFSWIGQFFSQIWGLLLGSAMMSMMGGMGDFGDAAAFGATSVIQIVVILVLWPIFYIIGVFIAAGILHLCVMVVGAASDSPLGFEGTLKVVAYSYVTQVAAVVPFLGGLVAGIGSLILMVIGFIHVHKTTTGKAIFAVLIPLIVCCVCGIVIAVVFGAAIAAMMSGAGG